MLGREGAGQRLKELSLPSQLKRAQQCVGALPPEQRRRPITSRGAQSAPHSVPPRHNKSPGKSFGPNQTRQNQTRPDQTQPDPTKPGQTKPGRSVLVVCDLVSRTFSPFFCTQEDAGIPHCLRTHQEPGSAQQEVFNRKCSTGSAPPNSWSTFDS